MSFPNPRHSADSTAVKTREQRCFHITLGAAAATLSPAVLWDSPQSTSANPPSLHAQRRRSSSAQLELQVMPARSLRALGTAAPALIKPEQLRSCHRNTFVVLQLSVGDVQGASQALLQPLLRPWAALLKASASQRHQGQEFRP